MLTIITPPAVEPVTLMEAKSHVRVEIADDDNLITALITTARESIEREIGRSMMTQTLRETVDGGRETIRLERAPVQAVTSVTLTDSNGTVSTIQPNQYVEADGAMKYLYGPWPIGRGFQAIQVDYLAGYGDAANDVPNPLKQAVLMLIGHFYENREAINIGNIVTELPFGVKVLIQPYKRYFSL